MRSPIAASCRSACPASWTAGASCWRSTARSRWRGRSAPAIRYARDGYAVSEIIADQWLDSRPRSRAIRRQPRLSCSTVSAPQAGEVFKQPHAGRVARADCQGRTRRLLPRSDRQGDRRRHAAAQRAADRGRPRRSQRPTGSNRSRPTIAATTSWSCRRTRRERRRSRCSTSSRAYDVKALGHNTAAYLHLLVEAKQIAFADRDAWLARSGLDAAGRAQAA